MNVNNIIVKRTQELVEEGFPFLEALDLAREEIKWFYEQAEERQERREIEIWMEKMVHQLKVKIPKLEAEKKKETIRKLEQLMATIS